LTIQNADLINDVKPNSTFTPAETETVAVGKMQSVRAIVRCPVPEYPWLEPGTVVAVSCRAFENEVARSFPATPEAAPEVFLWLRPTDLLAYRKFLLRQPVSEFWMLALKPRRQRRDTAMLLSDPWTLTFGPNGFRFESLGELVHFLSSHQLNPNEFLVCQTLGIEFKQPVWPAR
jgi:hypothetical protein